MDWNLIWKTILIVVVGTGLLRIAGRKSVSQLTIAQTVIMVSIGTLLIQPVVGKNVWLTFLTAAIMIGILILMEYVELKGDTFEKLLTGKSLTLIDKGKLNEKNMSKLRMTVDQLEMKLRQKNVSKLGDVDWATLEPNGQIGFMLKDKAKPATKKDLQQLSKQLNQLNTMLADQLNQRQSQSASAFHTPPNQQQGQDSLFKEVADKGHQTPPPKYLQ